MMKANAWPFKKNIFSFCLLCLPPVPHWNQFSPSFLLQEHFPFLWQTICLKPIPFIIPWKLILKLRIWQNAKSKAKRCPSWLFEGRFPTKRNLVRFQTPSFQFSFCSAASLWRGLQHATLPFSTKSSCKWKLAAFHQTGDGQYEWLAPLWIGLQRYFGFSGKHLWGTSAAPGAAD